MCKLKTAPPGSAHRVREPRAGGAGLPVHAPFQSSLGTWTSKIPPRRVYSSRPSRGSCLASASRKALTTQVRETVWNSASGSMMCSRTGKIALG